MPKSQGLYKKLADRQTAVLAMLSVNPHISDTDLAASTGISVRYVQRVINTLKASNAIAVRMHRFQRPSGWCNTRTVTITSRNPQ